jgi:hypothetical protein
MQPQSLELEADRRHIGDRRRHSWRTLTYCGLRGRGRRKTARRKGHDYYLDRFPASLVMAGIGILLLSSIDALMTLKLLTLGAHEANYFMLRLMEAGNTSFIAGKTLITLIGVVFLITHAHFHLLGVTSGKQVLQILLGTYVALIIYELTLWAVLI